MELDIQFPTACDLYLDGRLTESYSRRRAERDPILNIVYGVVSELTSAPFIFGQSIVTGEKARV
jgi:hypothetical protein